MNFEDLEKMLRENDCEKIDMGMRSIQKGVLEFWRTSTGRIFALDFFMDAEKLKEDIKLFVHLPEAGATIGEIASFLTGFTRRP